MESPYFFTIKLPSAVTLGRAYDHVSTGSRNLLHWVIGLQQQRLFMWRAEIACSVMRVPQLVALIQGMRKSRSKQLGGEVERESKLARYLQRAV